MRLTYPSPSIGEFDPNVIVLDALIIRARLGQAIVQFDIYIVVKFVENRFSMFKNIFRAGFLEQFNKSIIEGLQGCVYFLFLLVDRIGTAGFLLNQGLYLLPEPT